MRRPNLRDPFNHARLRRPTGFNVIFGAVVLGIAASAGVGLYYQTQGPETVRVTVTDKERQVSSDGDGGVNSKYVVFTDKEVFQNTDSLLRGKFNSSDVQGKMHIGCTYDAEVYGFRNHFPTYYRNIIDVKHVKTEACPQNKPRSPGL